MEYILLFSLLNVLFTFSYLKIMIFIKKLFHPKFAKGFIGYGEEIMDFKEYKMDFY